MDSKTCSDLNEEQLYMLEFLVDQVDLTRESIKRIGKSSICVRLKFIDCPIISLYQEEFINTKKKKSSRKLKEDKSKSTTVDFNMGKSCLFSKRPYDLIQAIRSKPLKVGIYKVEKLSCEPKEGEEETPICEAKVLLSGCLCDQMIIAMNDRNQLPKPYVLKNTYNLMDDQGNPFGTITLFLRLSYFGKTIETQFALREKSFLFKNSQSPNEFLCFNFPIESEMKREESPDPKIEERPLKPENVIGLTSICREFPPAEINLRDEMEELYRTQFTTFNEENDTNCSKSLTKVQSCGGGLCLGTKLLLKNDNTPKNPCNTGEDFKEGTPFRLRGGGCCTNNNASIPKSEKQTRGIIENPIYTNSLLKKDLYEKLSMETLTSGACKSAWKNTATPNKTGCGCFGKGGNSSKTPCTGVECFIRALKETQEFVDSLGKVPGLAGLGLMDPSESPYFGRQKEDADTCQPKSKKSVDYIRSPDTKTSVTLFKKGSRTKGKKPAADKSKDMITSPITYTATQTLPFSLSRTHADESKIHKQIKAHHKLKKKDVKGKFQYTDSKLKQNVKDTETGPCGDSKCRSRRKKFDDAEDSSSSSFNTEPKKVPLNGFPNGIKPKSLIKTESRIRKRMIGTHKKHSETSHTPLIKVSKKLMKQIYSLQERNPGVVYGHKNCLDLQLRVPKNMGWLWNTRNVLGRPPPQIGWKPGAVEKYVYDLLKEAKDKSEELEEEDDKPPTPVKVKKVYTPGITNFQSFGRHRRLKKEDSNQEIELPPTLHIHRKDGTYYITMYPIKSQNIAHPEIQQFVKPLQFKVTKDKKEDDASSDTSSWSVSDMEIEFSPPAAISRYRVKSETKSVGTQLKQQDILDAYKSSSIKSVKITK